MSGGTRQTWLDNHRYYTCSTCSATSRKPIDKDAQRPSECKMSPIQVIRGELGNKIVVGCSYRGAPTIILYKRIIIERLVMISTLMIIVAVIAAVVNLFFNAPGLFGFILVIPAFYVIAFFVFQLPATQIFSNEILVPKEAFWSFSGKVFIKESLVFISITGSIVCGYILYFAFRGH